MAFSNELMIATFGFVFYVLGASFVESFVNYPTWPFIDELNFQRYHRAASRRILIFLVIPYGAGLTLTAGLLWWRPLAIPVWNVWLSLALNLVVVLVSVVSQIPIQLEFDRGGWSSSQWAKLSHREWLRKGPLVANAILFLWMVAETVMTFPLQGGARR